VATVVDFDRWLATAINGLPGRSPAFDTLVLALAGNHLVKGGIVMSFVWAAWFCRCAPREVVLRRKKIVATLAAAAVALFVSAVVQHLVPMRPRPVHDPTLFLRAPVGLPSDVMTNWSSFPSDHATLFFSLATGLLFVSRPLGLAACTYVTFVIALPRVYVGWHYPSDVVAGAAIGVLLVWFAQSAAVRDRLATPVLAWARRHPQTFHAAFFVLSYQVATLMEDSRSLANVALRLLRGAAA